MSILDWVCEREYSGVYTFSFPELQVHFPLMPRGIIQNELSRLCKQRHIVSVYKAFYVKIPAHYKNREWLPPDFYIDQLMEYLGKPYYVGLLSAGELHGAAHQRPQRFCVFTTFPAANTSERVNPIIVWYYRRQIPDKLFLRKNSETSEILYSNAELTALDLVQYSQHIGGLSRAATVLAELLEKTDFRNVEECLFNVGTLAAFQRLGYIMEEILEDPGQALELYNRLQEDKRSFRWTALSKNFPATSPITKNDKWRILVNAELELDEI